jgi:acyl carrier protein
MNVGQAATNARIWSESEVRDIIHEIISDLSPSQGKPASELRLIEDLGYHSLSLLEMAFSLEDEFDLPTIDEETARNILTVRLVEEHVFVHLRTVGKLI